MWETSDQFGVCYDENNQRVVNIAGINQSMISFLTELD